MKKIDLGQGIGILANVGVIAGIIFLAVELRQNNDQLAAQITINQHEIRTNDIGRFAQDAGLAEILLKLRKGEQLSDLERERMFWVYAGRFLNWQLNYSLGALGTDRVAAIRAGIRQDRHLVEFWREFEPSLSPEFVDFINEEVVDDIEAIE